VAMSGADGWTVTATVADGSPDPGLLDNLRR
jgi:hypothetical protein